MIQALNFLYTNLKSPVSYIFANTESESMEETPVFGAKEWEQYGLIVKEPEIPQKFQTALEASCPFWPKQKIKETHFLCLKPRDLTYDQLLQLVSSGKINSQNFENADWILITKRIVPKTSALPFATQEQYLSTYNHGVPHTVEAALAVLCANHHKNTVFATRESSTRCQEKENSSYIVVGMDSNKKICSYKNNWDMHPGVAGVIR